MNTWHTGHTNRHHHHHHNPWISSRRKSWTKLRGCWTTTQHDWSRW